MLERFRSRTLKSTGGDPGSYIVTAKDSVSGEIAGIARFETIQHPPKTKEEMDRKYEEVTKSRRDEPHVAGVNEQLDEVFLRVIMYSEMETMAGNPYLVLNILGIRPSWQRRGVGTTLLKYVLEKADRLGLPVYLDSGVSGKALYERFGFKVIGDVPLNCLDYGGEFTTSLRGSNEADTGLRLTPS